jgi:myo-inositol-1(or 4)-monophosphatase
MSPTTPDHLPVPGGHAWTAELRAATDAARAAGRIQLDLLGRLERIVHKSAKDVVTEADHLSEEAIIDGLSAAFPADRFLAEESGHSGPHGTHEPEGTHPGDRAWIIDPLDGTVNYANALPFFCVSIGLVVDGRPTVGVVLDPVRDDLYCAVAGVGTWRNGQAVRHVPKEKLSDTIAHLALPPTRFARREARIRKAIRVTRVFGSAALALSYLADGRFDSYIQVRGLSLWDVAAAGLIAETAGATVTDTAGGPWFDLARSSRTVGIVAASPGHHAALLELLR